MHGLSIKAAPLCQALEPRAAQGRGVVCSANAGEFTMNKNALVAALVLVVVSGWLVSARAQEPSPQGEGPVSAFGLKIQQSHATPAPGQVGGPVESHPELRTPEHLKEETEAVKEYCRTHDCRSAVVDRLPAGHGASEEQSIPPGFREGVADPSDTIECRPDPANPNGLHLCYRASDHSRVYPGTPGPN